MVTSTLLGQIVEVDQGQDKPAHFDLEAGPGELEELGDRLGVEQVLRVAVQCVLMPVRGIKTH